MSDEQELEQQLKLERDADGDLTPASMSRLKKHLAQSKDEAAAEKNRLKVAKHREKKKKQQITRENAIEKEKVLTEVVKVAENKSPLITDNTVVNEIKEFYPDVLENKRIGWEPFPGPQTQFLEADEFEVLFSGGRAPGKALCLYEKVLTPTGFKTIEDIKVGDDIVCPDNTIAQVIEVPFDGEDECYRIEFIDGRVVDCSKNHLWSYEVSNRTLKAGSKRVRTATTAELLDKFNRYTTTKTKYKILIPLTNAVDTVKLTSLAIQPYTMGALLGDGSFRGRNTQITCYDPEIVARIKQEGYDVVSYANHNYGLPGLGDAKRALGLYGKLSHEKFIPEEYFDASIEVRYALLQGLMDTDGYSGGSKGTEYCSVSYQLANDIRRLVWSLGGKASIRPKQGWYKDKDSTTVACKTAYRVSITLPDNSKAFSLPRKVATANTKFNAGVTVPKLSIKNITPIGVQPCKCISINHPDKLFITSNYVVTHNSDALMMDALRYCGFKEFRGLVIRKAMKELRDLIKRAKELYPLCYPGTKWKEQEKLFVFPSGATIEFGYCDHEDDVEQYKGQEYSWLGIDELTEIPKEEIYEKLVMSVRKKGEHFKTYVRATTNPNGAGKIWVKKRFVDKGAQNSTIALETHIPQLNKTVKTTRKWIHGTVFDNPKILTENPEYVAMLSNIDNAVLRAQWLEGDWDSADGLAFDEFSRKTHVIPPFPIPDSWPRFRACDWGFATKAVNLWFAVDPEGTIYTYREFTAGGLTPRGKMQAKDFGAELKRIEESAGERVRYGILDASAWSQRGEDAPPPAEDMAGLTWRPSDRTKHSRVTGKLQVHKFLQVNPDTGKPGVLIFSNCTDLISCLSSLPIDKHNPEDVDTDCDDHAYDAFRYGLMSRPRVYNSYTFSNTQSETPIVFNNAFGF